jgi:hypothetical protein
MTLQHFLDYNSDRVPWPLTVPSHFLPLQLCTYTTPGRPRRVMGIRCGCTNYVRGVLQEVIWYSNVTWLNCYQYIPFIYVREVTRSRNGQLRSSNFVVRRPEVTMKGKGYGLRTCWICHLSILIYYLTTIRLHSILLFFLLFFYGGFGPFSGHGLPDLLPPSCLLLAATVNVYSNVSATPQTFLQILQTDPPSLLFNGYQGFFCRGKVTEAWIWKVMSIHSWTEESVELTLYLVMAWTRTLPGTCLVTILTKTDN